MLKDLFTQGCRGPRATHSKAQGHLNPSRFVTAYFSFIEITLRGWWSKVIPRATWNTTWAVSVRTRAPEQDLVSASSVYCSRPKPTAVKNSILPKMSSVTDTGEAQDLQGQPSKSCQHLLLWADTQECPKLSLLCLSGGWWRHTLGPQAAPLCLPAPPFSRHRSQQLIWVWLHPHQGGRGGLWGSWSRFWMSPWHRAGEGQGCARSPRSPSLVHPHSCLQKYLLWLPSSGAYYCYCGG